MPGFDDLPAGFMLDPAPDAAGVLPPGFTLDPLPGDSPPGGGANRPNPLPLAQVDDGTAPAGSTPVVPPPGSNPPAFQPPGDWQTDATGVSTLPSLRAQPLTPTPRADGAYMSGEQVRPLYGRDDGQFVPNGIRVPGQSLPGAMANAAGQGLVEGVGSAVSGLGTAAGQTVLQGVRNAQQGMRDQLAVMDQVDSGKTVPPTQDPLGYADMTPDQRAAARANLQGQIAAMPAPEQTGIGAPAAALASGAQDAGTALASWAQAALPVDTSKEGIATGAARGLGGLAPIIAAGLTPAGAAIVPLAIGAQSFDSSFRDAKAHGASDSDATQTAFINGAIQAGVMSAPLGGAIMKVTDPLLRDGLLKTAVNFGAHGIAFESAADAGKFADNYIARQTYDPNRKLSAGVGDQFAENLALSLVVPAAHNVPDLARTLLTPRITASPELRQGAAGLQEAAQDLQAAPPAAAPAADPADTTPAPAVAAPTALPADAPPSEAALPKSTPTPAAADLPPGFTLDPVGDSAQAAAPSPESMPSGDATGLPAGFTLDPVQPDADSVQQQAASLRPDAPAVASTPTSLDNFKAAMRRGESGGNDAARNPGSSASGRFQMLDGTFANFLKSSANGGRYTMADKNSPAAQDAAMDWLTAYNASTIRSTIGRDPTEGELAAAHLLGAGGALALIRDPAGSAEGALAKLVGTDRAAEIVAKNGRLLKGGISAQQALDNVARYYLGGKGNAPVGPIAGRPAGDPMPVYTNSGTTIDVQPMLVDLSDLVTSHDDDGKLNPDFPHSAGLQPRDRSSAASLSQVQELAGNLTPARLAPSSEAGSGAPIVSPDGVVESGNGRTMALRRVYTDPTLATQRAGYVDWLRGQGFDLTGMQQPVLVSQRVTPLDGDGLRAFTRDANERSTLGMNAAEQAQADASRVGASIDLYQGSNVSSAANAPFVRDIMRQMPAEERGSMMLPDGTLSPQGARRIQGAVTAHAYGDQLGPTLDRFLNGDDAGTKAVAGALSDAAGPWAQMRAAAARGEIPPALDVTPDLASAVETLSRARQLGRPVSELVAQTDLDRPPLSPVATRLLGGMFRDSGLKQAAGRDRVASTLADYAAEAMRQTPGQDMFGAPPPAPLAVLDAVRRDPAGSPAKARLLSARDAAQSLRHVQAAPDARTASPQAAAARQRLYDGAQALMRYMGLPPEVGLKLVDRMVDAATGQSADGAYTRGLIEFALDTPPDQVPGKLFHEIIHGLMDPELGLLTDGQRRALEDAGGRWLAKGDRRSALAATYGVDPASSSGRRVLLEEAIARMGEEALQAGLTARGSVGWLYRRMANFVGATGALLRGRGFRTADDVFRGLLQGRQALPGSADALVAAGPRAPAAALMAQYGVPMPAGSVPVGQTGNENGQDTRSPDASPTPPAPIAPAPAAPPIAAPSEAAPPTPTDSRAIKAPPGQLASRIAQLAAVPDTYRFSLRDAPDGIRQAQKAAGLPGFYSAVARTAALLKQERGSGPQFAAALRNAAGVKPEELRWLGVEGWLRGQTKVTRDQVLDYIAANNLGLREVVRGDSMGDTAFEAVDQAESQLRSALARDMGLDAEDPAVGRRLNEVLSDPDAAGGKPELQDALRGWHDAQAALERSADPATKYEDYQLPGGDNYREVLLTLPERPVDHAGSVPEPESQPYEAAPHPDDDLPSFFLDGDNAGAADVQIPFHGDLTPEEFERGRADWLRLQAERDAAEHQAEQRRVADAQVNYRSSHWPDANVVAHFRLNDRIEPDGKRVLFVEEVQSDWHQDGREQGYIGDAGASSEAVPDAPFRTSWPALAMKRILRMAADEGFDRVAWTNGDTQVDRYDLSRVARRVTWNADTGELTAFGAGGTFMVSRSARAEDLAGIVGKEAAASLRAAEPNEQGLRRYFPAAEMRLGGEGMRAFYDRILPNEVGRIVKPFDGQVTRGSIDLTGTGRTDVTPEQAQAIVHQVEMTPALRAAALEDGFPLYSLRETGTRAVQKMDEGRKGFTDMIRRTLAPITMGAKEAQDKAARFANAISDIQYRYGQMDRLIAHTFSHADRVKMWNALDDQSLFEIELQEHLAPLLPLERAQQETAARAAFRGQGLDALTPHQREVVEQLNELAKRTWTRMQERGLVNAKAEGLPYYSPRFFVLKSNDKPTVIPGRESGGSITAFDPLGLNLTTRKPLTRELRYTEDSIKAMRAKFGDNTDLVRDILTVGVALSKEERAVAGVDLVRSIKDYGAQIGTTLVTSQVPYGQEAEFKTIDHPSLTEMVPATKTDDDGNVEVVRDALGNPVLVRQPLKVHVDWEHPLRAVLTQPPGGMYTALMRLKGFSTGAIMFSPFMHLGVELGRALPAMPGLVLSLRWLRDGRGLRNDASFMSEAMQNGLRMVGGSWMQDITGIYDAPNVLPGHSVLARGLGTMGDLVNKSFGNDIREAVDKFGEFWHQGLLWDRVADLQVSIYRDMRAKYLAKGFDAKTASIMGAHLANRYAGAMPKEALSNAANIASNIAMFSRSFSLGNLGVMKDMLNGMPSYVRVQIEQSAGLGVAQNAASVLRRKAFAAFVADIGLFYATNTLGQTAMQLLNGQSLDDVAQGFVRRAAAEGQHLMQSPWEALNPFGVVESLLPTADNEPGKQSRIWMGNRADGTAVYGRLATGKIGEEFTGWMFSPATMVRNKASTMVRPVWEVIAGRDALGRPIYNPEVHGLGGMLHNAGLAVMHIAGSQLPFGAIQNAGTILRRTPGAILGTNTPLNNKDLTDAASGLLPSFAGAQISHGYPGGPDAGVAAAAQREKQFDRNQVMPEARRMLLAGNEDGARQLLTSAGMNDREIAGMIRSASSPQRGQQRMLRNFQRGASDGQRAQLQNVTGGSSSPEDAIQDAAAAGAAQANQMARSVTGH